MITLDQAQDLLRHHLGDSPKARHSRVVAHLMQRLAETKNQNPDLWEIVGLCHDIDDTVTKDDRSRHGMLAAIWLDKRLPEDALEAIRAHDHRTGVFSDTELADALKLADAIAIADETVGRTIFLEIGSDAGWQKLLNQLEPSRPYIGPILSRLALRLGLDRCDMADLLKEAPREGAQV